MNSIKKNGRIIGLLFLIQFIMGVLTNFMLLGPVIYVDDPLGNIETNSHLVIIASLLLLVLSIISISIAILLFPILKQSQERITILYLSFCIISFCVTILDNTILLSLVSLGESTTSISASETNYLQVLGNLLIEVRGWTHITDMLMGSFSLLTLYYLFFKSKLIPNVLSVFGLFAALLMFINVISSFFEAGIMLLYLPVGLIQVTIGIWLVSRGFHLKNNSSEPL